MYLCNSKLIWNYMKMIKCIGVSRLLCFAVVILSLDVSAKDGDVRTDNSSDNMRYDQLIRMEKKDGRGCMRIFRYTESTLTALRNFVKEIRFIDLAPHKPIKAELPEDYYHPQGSVVTFDQFELALKRNDLPERYITMTRTPEGVELAPKVVINPGDGAEFCVSSISATIKYRPLVP